MRDPGRNGSLSGFTLVEMLAVMAIMTLLLTLGVMFMRDTGPRVRRAATDQMISLLDQARTTAITTRSHVILAIAPPGTLPTDDDTARVGLLALKDTAWPSNSYSGGSITATLLNRWTTIREGVVFAKGQLGGEDADLDNLMDLDARSITYHTTTIEVPCIVFSPRGNVIYPGGSGPIVLRIAEGVYRNGIAQPKPPKGGVGYVENVIKIGRVTGRPYPDN